MNVPRWLKIIGYPTWFFVCLVTFLYLTFPMAALKSQVEQSMETNLGKGRFGHDAKVTIGKLDTYYVTGVHLERLSIRYPSSTTEPGPTVEFDEMNLRVPMMPNLFGSPTLETSGKLYEGNFDGLFEIKNEKAADERMFGEIRALLDGKLQIRKSFRTAVLNIDGLKLDRAPPVIEALGLPVSGTLTLNVDLDLGKDASKDSKGSIALKGTGLSVGEGKLPIAGGFSVPFVDLGTLDADIQIAEGKGEAKKFKLDGRDVTAEVQPSLRMRKDVLTTNISGPGWFKLSDSFLKENGKFKAILFDFPGPQKAAKDEQDRFHFGLRGSLKSPSATLSKSGGKSGGKSKRARNRSRRKR